MSSVNLDSFNLDKLLDIHFLRPEWLYALPLCLAVYWVIKHFSQQAPKNNLWLKLISPELISALQIKESNKAQQGILNKSFDLIQRQQALFASLLLAILLTAVSGPSWEKSKQAVFENQHKLILVLDLSLSMYAEDEKPSRLVKAKRKIKDILDSQGDGEVALIAYSGDAHIVSPFTDDTQTIYNLLSALEPNIMPKFGSNPVRATELALSLLQSSASPSASLLFLTDEISARHMRNIGHLLNQSSTQLQTGLITFGTISGAPIPIPSQGFLKNKAGQTIVAKANLSEMKQNAHFATVIHNRFDNKDFEYLMTAEAQQSDEDLEKKETHMYLDGGAYLLWLALPFFLFILFHAAHQPKSSSLSHSHFKSLFLFLGILTMTSLNSPQAHAFSWQDLWQTPNQQAQKAFDKQDYETAAEKFDSKNWQASSQYKQGDYESALEGFSQDNSAEGLYNQANSLAQLGRLEEALERYDQAISQQADFKQAQENKALIEDLLKQQKEQEQQQEQQDGDQDHNSDQNSDQNKQEGQNSQESQENENSQNAQSQQDENDTSNTDTNDSDTNDDADGQQEEQLAQQQNQTQNTNQNEAQEQATDQTQLPMQTVDPIEQEKQQALQQWLKRIPDDPSQLMRNKFQYEHQLNRRNREVVDSDSDQLW